MKKWINYYGVQYLVGDAVVWVTTAFAKNVAACIGHDGNASFHYRRSAHAIFRSRYSFQADRPDYSRSGLDRGHNQA